MLVLRTMLPAMAWISHLWFKTIAPTAERSVVQLVIALTLLPVIKRYWKAEVHTPFFLTRRLLSRIRRALRFL